MKSLQDELFNNDFRYMVSWVNGRILIIKHSNDERRVARYKAYLFKMMKGVVEKNIKNYIYLLTNKSSAKEIPDFDELIAECYIIFDKCMMNYKVKKGNNFYFFFNKALSRNFFKQYQTTLTKTPFELTEVGELTHPDLQEEAQYDTLSMQMDVMGFSDLEKRIALARMNGQRSSEFLKENEDVTENQYSRSLKRIKELLKENEL